MHSLVDLEKLEPKLKFDIQYARADNFIGFPVYKLPKAYLQKPVAEALVRVHHALKEVGCGILVFDAYRPWSVTKVFYDHADENQKDFLADPAKGSVHNRGCAIDCSLFDLKTGKEIRMPSAFDEMNERAFSNYAGGDPEERRWRDILISAMAKEDFKVITREWWHFNHKEAPNYPVLDLSFEELIAEGV